MINELSLDASEKLNKLRNINYVAGGVGNLAGIYFAYKRGSKWYGYIGWAFLFGAIGGIATSLYTVPKAGKIIAEDAVKQQAAKKTENK